MGVSYAADSTSFNPVPIVVKAQSAGGVPVGTVVTWTQNTLPSGPEEGKWLECNGQSTAGFPELAAVVGPIVPDYRGLFLRHVGGNSIALGMLQADMLGSHAHTVYGNNDSGFGIGGATLGSAGPWQPLSGYTGGIETRPKNKAVKYIMKARP